MQNTHGRLRFFCQTCPYIHRLEAKASITSFCGPLLLKQVGDALPPSLGAQVESEILLDRKGVDDVLGGADAWKNADQADGEPASPTASSASHTRDSFKRRLPASFSARSNVSALQPPSGVLPAVADPLGRRAHDHLLQMRRMRSQVARGLSACRYSLGWRGQVGVLPACGLPGAFPGLPGAFPSALACLRCQYRRRRCVLGLCMLTPGVCVRKRVESEESEADVCAALALAALRTDKLHCVPATPAWTTRL